MAGILSTILRTASRRAASAGAWQAAIVVQTHAGRRAGERGYLLGTTFTELHEKGGGRAAYRVTVNPAMIAVLRDEQGAPLPVEPRCSMPPLL